MALEDHDPRYEGRYPTKSVAYGKLINKVQTEARLGSLIRELKFTMVFFVVYLFFLFAQADTQVRFQTEAAISGIFRETRFPMEPGSKVFLKFTDIQSPGNYWQWVKDVVVLKGLMPSSSSGSGLVGEYNQLLWGVRFKQVRVVELAQCPVPKMMLGFEQPACYPPFSADMETTEAYGPPPYEYSTASQNGENSFEGEIAEYPGGGFVVDVFYSNMSSAIETIREMEATYIDKQTRAVFTEMVFYNSNLNTFCHGTFLVEFGSSGIIVSKTQINSAVLVYPSGADKTRVLIFGGASAVYMVFFILNFLYSLRSRRTYATPLWSLIDLSLAGLFTVQIVDFVQNFILTSNRDELIAAVSNPNAFGAAVGTQIEAFVTLQNFHGMVLILFCFRMFKWLKIFEVFGLLWGTLRRAVKEILFFLVMFSILFAGYAICGYLVFGPYVYDYRSVMDTISTLLRVILGEIDYHELAEANRVFAPFFFASFMILFFFILVNIFLAIILDAWRVESEMRSNRKELKTSLTAAAVQRIKDFSSGVWGMITKPRKRCGPVCKSISNFIFFRRQQSGWLSKNEVYSRLRDWKKRSRNQNVDFVNFKMIKQALQGELRNFQEVRNTQVDKIMASCKQFLLSEEDVAKVKETGDYSALGATDAVDTDETPLHSLKRLLNSFRKLKANQVAYVSKLQERVESLKVLQTQTREKVDFLDRHLDSMTANMD